MWDVWFLSQIVCYTIEHPSIINKIISFLPALGDLPDRHVTPIAMVFDELKDYLSESDLSLDYKIARSRSKKKKVYRNSRIFANSTEYSHQGM